MYKRYLRTFLVSFASVLNMLMDLRKRMNLVEPIEINGNNRPEGRDHSTDAKHKLVKQVPFNQSNPEVNLEPEQERDIQTQA